MKTCPYCAEEIQDAAIKCKHCGEHLDDRTAAKAIVPCTRIKEHVNGWQRTWVADGDPTDLFELIRSAVNQTSFVIEESDTSSLMLHIGVSGANECYIRVSPHPDYGSMAVFTAQGRRRAVMATNLISNAARFTSTLGPLIDPILRQRQEDAAP